MKNILLSLSILSMLFVNASLAQPVLTLEEAIQLAVTNNRYIKIAENKEAIASNSYHIGNAGFLPSVDLSGSTSYSNQEQNNNGIKTTTKSTANSANIAASYTLFDGLSRIYNYNKLETESETSKLENRQQKENVISNVITAYYNVAKASDQLTTMSEALAISSERLMRTEKKQELGQAGKIDFLNSKVDFNSDSVNFINAKTNLVVTKQKFNLILNREINTDFTVNAGVEFNSLPTISELLHSAEEKNADNLIAQNNISIAEQNVNLATSEYLPTLSLKASYGYNGLYNDFNISLDDPNSSFTTSLNLNFNLFNGFKNSIQKQNAEALLDNSQLLSDQTKIEIRNDLLTAYENYRNSRTILELESQNLEAAQSNFERSKELYDLGKITNTEFRQAQLNLIQARNSISSAKYNAKIYETEIKRICGILINNY